MATISNADKFRGSLFGAYIGHYYSEKYSDQWPTVSRSTLYQAWLASIEQYRISPPSEANLTTAIPWLLYRHDDSSGRLHWLHQTLVSPTMHTNDSKGILTDTIGALYVLGDCLEWLMQYPIGPQELHSLLWKYLHHKRSSYPSAINSQIHQYLEQLATQSPALILQTTDNTHHPLMTVTAALKCCLNYRENLALALTNPGMTAPIATIVGCLLGAYCGPSVIPVGWLMAFTQDSREALDAIAQKLYGVWAGVGNVTTNFEVLPLDF